VRFWLISYLNYIKKYFGQKPFSKFEVRRDFVTYPKRRRFWAMKIVLWHFDM